MRKILIACVGFLIAFSTVGMAKNPTLVNRKDLSPPDYIMEAMVTHGVRYGCSKDAVRKILATLQICGRRFSLVDANAVPKELGAVQSSGLSGIQQVEGSASECRGFLAFEDEKLVGWYWHTKALNWENSNRYLPGSPKVLASALELQNSSEKAIGEYYWRIQDQLGAYLRTRHLESEVRPFLKEILADVPAVSWSYELAKRRGSVFTQSVFAEERHDLDCNFASTFVWDRIMAIRIDPNNLYYDEGGRRWTKAPYPQAIAASELSWTTQLVANLFCLNGMVVGVIFKMDTLPSVAAQFTTRNASLGATLKIDRWVIEHWRIEWPDADATEGIKRDIIPKGA